MQITSNWIKVIGGTLWPNMIRPVCMYCYKPCRKGSWADHLWPYHDDFSWHWSCRRKAERRKP